ncbi:histidine kinase [Spirosoma sp. BT702]|uniref:Histidine kinase n=1 Tax=Spirosoma profusum TaxID=2771354 RepID=A0A926XSG5_9BACT|nr:histidine kinase [Spirosoma profusum]MBD2699038.1 histidine kinase [Spirosoma profusum]
MDVSDNINLTLPQKIRLAATVFAIYWPLRFYINLNSLDIEKVSAFWWFIWLSEIPITIALFTFWLSLTEWLENKLNGRSGRLFQRDGKFAVQLTTLLIAAVLSFGFDWAFFGYLGQARKAFDQTETAMHPGQVNPITPEIREFIRKNEGQRRHKATTALTVMALLMAYYLAANHRRDKVVAQLQVSAEQLKREASQAQFDALRTQVNPHFLFNSLSILSSLVDVNPKLSIRFINHLSRAYRYILEQQDTERVNLKTELEFLGAYCFLLTIRFDDRFQLVNSISEEESMRFNIAPLTLQLLMENAVKHNQMSRRHPLIVTLAIEECYLLISNFIQPRLPDEIFPENSTGIGLANITNRYRLLTDRPVLITQQDNTFTVSIPLLQ